AAEEPNVRKNVQMFQRNIVSFRSAHRQSSHCAMRLIRDRAEFRIDVRNQFVHQHLLKSRVVAQRGEPTVPETICAPAPAWSGGNRGSAIRPACGSAAAGRAPTWATPTGAATFVRH